jgi:hypothetical protein
MSRLAQQGRSRSERNGPESLPRRKRRPRKAATPSGREEMGGDGGDKGWIGRRNLRGEVTAKQNPRLAASRTLDGQAGVWANMGRILLGLMLFYFHF